MVNARISMFKQVKAGTPFQVRVLIEHPMETGFRPDAGGKVVPRNSLNKFVCSNNGVTVFEAQLYPALSVNPYLTFWLKLSESATLQFRWEGDAGFVHEQMQKVEVTA
jgi:sulfur-oxidizing protein SoxZ